MVIRGLATILRGINVRRCVVALGLVVLCNVTLADTGREDPHPETRPEADDAEKSMQEIRIKRLRPADPESKEVMLVIRGSGPSTFRVS